MKSLVDKDGCIAAIDRKEAFNYSGSRIATTIYIWLTANELKVQIKMLSHP